jgi:hypothetical protein
MKSFFAALLILITPNLITATPSGTVLKRNDPFGNQNKLHEMFLKYDNEAVFLLDRTALENIALDREKLKRYQELYEECKGTMRPNSFMTPRFLIGSVVVSLSVGALIGFVAFK